MVNAWSRLGALAIIAIAATGCGTRVLGHQSTPTSSRPTTQAQPSSPASAASQPPISGASPSAQSACPPWILQDITIADHAKLPVSTTELEGFIGVAMATPQTLPDWLGESPATPIGDALDGLAWSSAMATRGNVVAEYTGGKVATLRITEPQPTSWQSAEIKKLGWPVPPPSSPIQWQFSVLSPEPTAESAFRTLVQQVEAGKPYSIGDLFPTPAPAPRSYQTYAGPIQLKTFAYGPSCPVKSALADFMQSGTLTLKPYWSFAEANGISVGFAPGYVMIFSGHAGILTTLWYREPAIQTPPFSQTPGSPP